MSTDLSVIKNALATVELGLDDDSLAVAGGARSAKKRISIEGGVFRKIAAGKEVGVIEDRHMPVIFVKMAHEPSRTYYESAYVKGAKVSPACWSSNSKVPDPEVKSPKAKSCDQCPFSVKGSAANGKSSACRLSWRTAVVLPQDPAGDVMQLVIPSASIWGDEDAGRWPFRSYIRMLVNNNISAGRVVTKMQFDTKASGQRLLFSPMAAVPKEELEVIVRQSKSEAAESAVKLTVYQTDETEEDVTPVAPVGVEASADPEPVLRGGEPQSTGVKADAAELINRWKSK
jgi:hypothetical protein